MKGHCQSCVYEEPRTRARWLGLRGIDRAVCWKAQDCDGRGMQVGMEWHGQNCVCSPAQQLMEHDGRCVSLH